MNKEVLDHLQCLRSDVSRALAILEGVSHKLEEHRQEIRELEERVRVLEGQQGISAKLVGGGVGGAAVLATEWLIGRLF